MLTRSEHGMTRIDKDKDQAYKDKTRTRLARTRTSLAVRPTYCKLQLNIQSLSSNNN